MKHPHNPVNRGTLVEKSIIASSRTSNVVLARSAAVLFVLLLMVSSFAPLGKPLTQDALGDSLSSWGKLFYLHEGTTPSTSAYDWLNSSDPRNPGNPDYDGDGLLGVTIKKNVPSQKWRHFWALDPEVSTDIHITVDILAHVWAASRDNESGTILTVRISDMDPASWLDPDAWILIASGSTPLQGPVYSAFKPYNITMSGVDYILPADHRLVLTIQRGDSINDGLMIVFDTDYWDSLLSFTFDRFISVDQSWTEDDAGQARSVFSDLEAVTLATNISDPFGAYDIVEAYYRVVGVTNGTEVISWTSMVLRTTDPSPIPYWKVFSSSFSGLTHGDYRATVIGQDSDGSPSWANATFTVVTVDHFDLTTPSSIVAGTPFSMQVSARNASGDIVDNWVGTVTLSPYKTDLVTAATGSLSISSIVFTDLDGGVVTIPNQNYSYAEETIAIEASTGPRLGWSSSIDVFSGPVVVIALTPSGDLTLGSGAPQGISAEGTDANGNTNTTWNPVWSVVGGIGTISGSGLAIVFTAGAAGSGSVTCTNSETGASASILVTVNAGTLSYILLSPVGPIEVREGQTRAVTANGYDGSGNPVDISGSVNWYTNTSGSILGFGPSITFRAGFIPEIGIVRAYVGGVSADLEVRVITSPYGPWLSNIPLQIGFEDGNWTLNLGIYWHHDNGTSNLVWSTEGVDNALYFVSHDPTSNSIVRFVTQPDEFGSTVFRLWVRDPDGFSAYQDISVSIQPVNDRPRFIHEPPTELYVKFDTPYSFDYSYFVSDVDTSQSDLKMKSDEPDLIVFEGLIGDFLFPERDGENSYFEIVQVTVTDASDISMVDATNSDSINVVVRVTTDTPPSLNGTLEPFTINEGAVRNATWDLDDYFYDLDNEALFYSSGFENVVVEIDEVSHIVYVSAPTEWSGDTPGVFTARDTMGALKTAVASLTVVAVNDFPSFESPGTIHVRYGVVTYMDLRTYVNDPDNSFDELSFSFDSPNASYLYPDLILLFPANMSGGAYTEPYLVKFNMQVADPIGDFTVCPIEVLVSDNYPPFVTSPVPYDALFSFAEDTYLNGSLLLGVLFGDIDGETLTYAVRGNTNILPVIYGGVVNFSAKQNWSGSEFIEFVAFDSHHAWASWEALVVVVPVNDAPWIRHIPDLIVRGGPRNSHYHIAHYISDSETPYSSLRMEADPSANVAVVGDYLYYSIPAGVDVITVSLYAVDADGTSSNVVEFKVGVKKTTAEIIGYPYSLPLVLLAAGVAGYFMGSRIPRPYALENLFLIHNDGRLIANVTKMENTTIDKDVVSAMFTAVQEFVRDSFQQGEIGLKKLEIGNKNVMIEKGEHVYLAMIYSGWPRKEIFESLTMLLRDIEERYKGRIEKWNGTGKTVRGVEPMLHTFMAGVFKPGDWQAEEEKMGEQEWVDIIEKES